MLPRYRVADPNSYLVITGAGIDGISIRKKALLLPLQKSTTISISPFDFSMKLQAMTIEKLKFSLPAVFTIGPAVADNGNDTESLKRYATLLTGESDGRPAAVAGRAKFAVSTGRNHVQDVVKGIIEGETRSLVSNMTMEEVFRGRAVFKQKVIENVQEELHQFGLKVYNANVKELEDSEGSEYFAVLGKKAHEAASSQARVDVAEAKSRGNVGQAEKESRAKQEIAKINATTAVLETERKGEKAAADAKLVEKEISIEKELNLGRIAAKRAAESKDTELQQHVEVKRANMELERRRATDVVNARIARESEMEKAEASLFSHQKQADAAKYKQTADAEAKLEARRREAEGVYVAKKAEADAALLVKQAEAQGLADLAKSYGELAQVLGGPQGLMQYLMMQNNLHEKLALANAKAINGLQPKINVWNTGSDNGAPGSDAGASIRNIFQTLPPLMSTINEQTGMSPPQWLMQMPQESNNAATSKESKINGTYGR